MQNFVIENSMRSIYVSAYNSFPFETNTPFRSFNKFTMKAKQTLQTTEVLIIQMKTV